MPTQVQNNMKEQYKSLWDFLVKTPKNMFSVMLIWAMAIAGIILGTQDFEELKSAGFIIYVSFLILIIVLGYVRVYLLYINNKWSRK